MALSQTSQAGSAEPSPEAAAPKAPRRTGWRKHVGRLIAVLVSLLIAEGLLHLLTALVPPVARAIVPVRKYVYDQSLGFEVPNPEYPGHDRWGFHNDRVPASAEIVAFGDSQTYGYNATGPQAWPAVLGKTAGCPVYNMGFDHLGPPHYLFFLERARKLSPKLILAAVYAGNDLYDAYGLVYSRMPATDTQPTAKPAQPGAAAAEQRLLRRILPWGQAATLPALDSIRGAPPYDELTWRLLRHVRLAGLGYVAWNTFFRRREEDWDWDRIMSSGKGTCDGRWPLESGPHRTVFTPADRWKALNPADDRIIAGERIVRDSLVLLRDRAKELGATLVVVLIPTKELVYEQAVEDSDSAPPETFVDLCRAESAYWDRTRAYLKQAGIPAIDALGALRRSLDAGEKPYRMCFDGHPTPAGYAAIGTHVAGELKRLHLTGTPPTSQVAGNYSSR